MLKVILILSFALTIIAVSAKGTFSNEKNPTICDKNVKQYSGFFDLKQGNKSYFYWMFESRRTPSTDPILLWLTGGPGCSSELALFTENGPCKVNSEGTDTTNNPYSWNTQANLLYIDQPPGTGFSTGKYDNNETQVAEDTFEFLVEFYKAHPEYAKNDFFNVGESYAGHYVPAIAHRIYTGNKNKESSINMKGVSIGNGLTDPEIQYKYYPQMAYNSTSAPRVPGWTEKTYKYIESSVPGCIKSITNCNSNAKGAELSCYFAYENCNMNLVEPVEFSGINLYDLRIKCAKPPLCYDFSNVAKYVNSPAVQAAIGVTNKWQDCNRVVTIGFLLDWMHDFQNKIPDLLEAGIPVLVYAGDQDFICNWLGNQAWTLALEWSGKEAFNNAANTLWGTKTNSSGIGMLRKANGFNFLRVYQAGHMVPRDQPQNALVMINDFMDGKL